MAKPYAFEVQVRPVLRRGASTVYRIRLPDEVAKRRDVEAAGYVRLKLLRPNVEGATLEKEDFVVKVSPKKTAYIPIEITTSKGLEKLKSPATVKMEYVCTATKADRTSKRRPTLKPIRPAERPPTHALVEEPYTPPEVAEEAPPPIHEEKGIAPPTKPTEVPSPPFPIEAPPPTPTTTKKKEPVESPGLVPLRDAAIRIAKNAAIEEARKICRELIPKEVGEQVEALIAERMETLGRQVEALIVGSEVTMPKGEREEKSPQAPTEAEPTQPVEEPVHEEEVRVISVSEPPRDYGVVREELPEALPEKPAPAPIDTEGDIHVVETPTPTPAETLRFEKDSDCISIFIDQKYVSTVSVEVQASGTVYHCGVCSVEAMEKKMKEPTDCEHIRMVKQYLTSSTRQMGVK